MSPAVPYRVVGFHILPLATYAANNVGYPASVATVSVVSAGSSVPAVRLHDNTRASARAVVRTSVSWSAQDGPSGRRASCSRTVREPHGGMGDAATDRRLRAWR